MCCYSSWCCACCRLPPCTMRSRAWQPRTLSGFCTASRYGTWCSGPTPRRSPSKVFRRTAITEDTERSRPTKRQRSCTIEGALPIVFDRKVVTSELRSEDEEEAATTRWLRHCTSLCDADHDQKPHY